LLDQEERRKLEELDNQDEEDRQSRYEQVQMHEEAKKQKIDEVKGVLNKWNIFCLIGNIIQICASFLSLFDTKHTGTGSEILIGFGCMFAFINIARYIEYSESYSIIYTTIRGAMPNVVRYLIGVMPIFLGFVFFGLCIFWKSERFTSTSDVMIILFALAQGDSVYDTFKDLKGFSFFIGQIYLYLFCILFLV
jgi:hypothetical protein